jgi:hypothetical protein
VTLLVAAAFCAITFYPKGGLNVETMIGTEMPLTLGSGAIVALAAIFAPPRGRVYGAWAAVLLFAFTALSALSIVWSVQPDYSWLDAGRLLAYSAVFAAAIALVRAVPERWPAILGGLALSAVIVCAYALLSKVFPASIDRANTFARINEPYGYWNAVGLSAAMGVICCMWLGARRSGHALLRALAYPAVGLLLTTLVLAYSRGALAALALGLALWFAAVPLRLRSAALLSIGALGAGVVLAWDLSRHALSTEAAALPERVQAGHELGVLLLAMLLALTAVGVAIGFATGRRAPSSLARRRAGLMLAGAIVLALLAVVGALAHSQRGLTGTISHDLSALTDPNAKPPPNTAGRLTAVASVRARYWKEALEVFEAHPLLGAGAEGFRTAHLRYEDETLEVRHAHGFVVQTLADLGIVGLALALALLLAWATAAGRATHLFNRGWRPWRAWRDRSRGTLASGEHPRFGQRSGAPPGWRALAPGPGRAYTAERIGMLAMLCLVVVFGVHSLADWTWYVPGDACVALLCAGWLAGRGPLASPAAPEALTAGWARAGAPERAGASDGGAPLRGMRTRLARAGFARLAFAAAAIVAALLAAWSQWQPQHAEETRERALTLLSEGHGAAALQQANSASSRDPLSIEALVTLASVQQASGQLALARRTLERGVRQQPSNPQAWLALGRYQLTLEPAAAVHELQAAIYLDPESISPEAIAAGKPQAIQLHNEYIQALQAAEAAALKSASEARARAAAAARRAARTRPRSARPRSRRLRAKP